MNPALILIWGFSDPIHPQLVLHAPDDIYCFKFNPTDPNIVAAGCVNGQVSSTTIVLVGVSAYTLSFSWCKRLYSVHCIRSFSSCKRLHTQF